MSNSYRIKIAAGFENDFTLFVSEKSDLIAHSIKNAECDFTIEFKSVADYREFYDLLQTKIDLISSEKTSQRDSQEESYWHAVGVVAGREIRIAQQFDDCSALDEKIEEVYVPKVDKVVWTDQETSKIVQECMSPGYIFVKSQHISHILAAAKRMRLKVSVLGSNVPQKEIDALRNKSDQDCNLEQKHSYSIGDLVEICVSPFKGFRGSIVEIDNDRSKQLKVELSVFGRSTHMKLAFSEVKKDGGIK